MAHRRASQLGAALAGHSHDVPLGLIEAVSGMIAALRRPVRGYRSQECFKLKILQRRSLPDNPRARAVR